MALRFLGFSSKPCGAVAESAWLSADMFNNDGLNAGYVTVMAARALAPATLLQITATAKAIEKQGWCGWDRTIELLVGMLPLCGLCSSRASVDCHMRLPGK